MNSQELLHLLQLRAIARYKKDYVESDRIRDLMKQNGIMLEDKPDCTSVAYGICPSTGAGNNAELELLRHEVSVLRKREHDDCARIVALVKENLSLKYGGTKHDQAILSVP